ncbi:MAG: hypothetical protein BKP49_09900 [Treponema sp. CETP13]|nr:MAG: hypothetical protein BKP49_09900 [Treponema sp. CETP13]
MINNNKYSKLVFGALFISFFFFIFSSFSFHINTIPDEIRRYVNAYPGIVNVVCYDQEKNDWLLNINGVPLFWAGSRFLPEKELDNSSSWRPHLDYTYSDTIPNPNDKTVFSDELVSRLKSEDFYKARKLQNPYYTGFYNALYDCASRTALEKHIVNIKFLGHYLNIHEKLVSKLFQVEKQIYALRDKEIKHGIKPEYGTVQFFLDQLLDIQGYSWREVSDTSNPSQHSRGIALDILPKGWKTKNMYWRWRADWDSNWMLLPLENRWMPAPDVIKAFENEGFIWGGKWILWDNMHFEYRPELCRN